MDRVLATDIRSTSDATEGPFQVLDATDARAVGATAMRFGADTVYHLAAILSGLPGEHERVAGGARGGP